MITGRREAFERRCRERGYELGPALACVVADLGDIIVVDETHPAYPKAKPLPFVQKVANFVTSAAKHVAAGAPQCTDEEVAVRFAICQRCEHYDGRACLKCGCPVVREKQFISKLSWAAESCPVGKWGPIAKDD